MITTPDGKLHVYMVNVGQGDTTVIVSPEGSVMVIDATRPGKLVTLLKDLGLDGTIEQLVITHPHKDHFSGGNRLANDFTILEATLAPYWHQFGTGPATYRDLVGRLNVQDTSCTFLSGYSRWFPDGSMVTPPGTSSPEIDATKPFYELLGPTNGMVHELEEAKVFNTNHLSIITRLRWNSFRMIIAGDAQMENWQFFDRELLLKDKCQVLRTAHHGSSNGTQWERINRLSPSEVIVSSDPDAGHHLPDLPSAAIFTKLAHSGSIMAVITRDTGTIHLTVTASGQRTYEMYGDSSGDDVVLGASVPLPKTASPTDWPALLTDRIASL